MVMLWPVRPPAKIIIRLFKKSITEMHTENVAGMRFSKSVSGI